MHSQDKTCNDWDSSAKKEAAALDRQWHYSVSPIVEKWPIWQCWRMLQKFLDTEPDADYCRKKFNQFFLVHRLIKTRSVVLRQVDNRQTNRQTPIVTSSATESGKLFRIVHEKKSTITLPRLCLYSLYARRNLVEYLDLDTSHKNHWSDLHQNFIRAPHYYILEVTHLDRTADSVRIYDVRVLLFCSIMCMLWLWQMYTCLRV